MTKDEVMNKFQELQNYHREQATRYHKKFMEDNNKNFRIEYEFHNTKAETWKNAIRYISFLN